jgi:hypothetical protein
MATEKKSEAAWSQRDETNFINGLGTHGIPDGVVDINTIETLLNRYRMALCKRAANGVAGLNIDDALNLVDRRLNEIREIGGRVESAMPALKAA